MFIPLFLICNVRPAERGLTGVYMESDIAYIIVMALFRYGPSLIYKCSLYLKGWNNFLFCSISNGYVGSICMMSAPQVKTIFALFCIIKLPNLCTTSIRRLCDLKKARLLRL